MTTGLLAAHAASTWFMVGLIWTIQSVHYPLFDEVGESSSPGYAAGHTRRMSKLLIVPASVEVVTAALLIWLRPVAPAWPLLSGAVLGGIWAMTAFVQVPLHRQLATGHSTQVVRRLVATNRWRTAAWSLRGGMALAMFWA